MSATLNKPPLFPMGVFVATPGAINLMHSLRLHIPKFLNRHLSGDWGDIDPEDRKLNDQAVQDGNRIISCYELTDTDRVWFVTESDRSVTTLLLPEEY